MAPPELSITAFNTVCTKAEGRDKLARLAQYAARAIVGITALGEPQAGTMLLRINERSRNVMSNLATARRAHRWWKEIPVLQAIPKSLELKDPLDRCFEVLQKLSTATFMVIDHIGWLKQVKIMAGGKRSGVGTIQLGLKFFCFANFVATLYQAKKALQLAKEKQAERRKCLENVVKHSFLVVQTAHLSQLYLSHDFLVGVLGMITSTQDLLPQWPEKKPVKPAD
mmetsp:Transcript_13350/g.30447  ORF Transcript_13350/g.30447 Transcript_13350/m.30447 type:complete len:225 (-) Transcript_13350:84-758(-)